MSKATATSAAVRAGDERSRRATLQPEHEREQEQRHEREQVPLREVSHVARCEDADFDDEPGDERDRRRNKGANVRIVLASLDGAPREHEQRAERHDAADQHEVAEVVEDVARRLAGVVARFSRQPDTRRGPSSAVRRAAAASRSTAARRAAGRRAPERARAPGCGHDGARPRGRPQSRTRAGRRKPACRAAQTSTIAAERERLAAATSVRQRHAPYRPRREHGGREEHDLRHDQPRVREARRGERDHGRDERPPARHELAAPEVDGSAVSEMTTAFIVFRSS